MARSAFLKFSLQCRIGHMNGVVVAYHNTQQVFGLEYIPLEEMDRITFGSAGSGHATSKEFNALVAAGTSAPAAAAASTAPTSAPVAAAQPDTAAAAATTTTTTSSSTATAAAEGSAAPSAASASASAATPAAAAAGSAKPAVGARPAGTVPNDGKRLADVSFTRTIRILVPAAVLCTAVSCCVLLCRAVGCCPLLIHTRFLCDL